MTSYKILCDIGDAVYFNIAGRSAAVKLSDIGLAENIDRIYRIQFHKPPKANQLDYIVAIIEQRPNISLRFYGDYDESLIIWDKLVNIEDLQIDLWHTRDLAGLSRLKNLKSLAVNAMVTSKVSLSVIEPLENLNVLYTSISKDIETVGKLKNLEKLSLREIKNDNLDFLASLKSLNTLWLSLGSFKDFDGIKNINSLANLWIHQVRGISDEITESVFALCKTLSALKLDNLKHISRLDFLKHMSQLTYLSMEGVAQLDSYDPILESRPLTTLSGYQCRPIDRSLYGLKNLKNVQLGDSYVRSEIDGFLKSSLAENIWLRGKQLRGTETIRGPFTV